MGEAYNLVVSICLNYLIDDARFPTGSSIKTLRLRVGKKSSHVCSAANRSGHAPRWGVQALELAEDDSSESGFWRGLVRWHHHLERVSIHVLQIFPQVLEAQRV